ncbi:hypothetical protein KQI68_06580 [Peptoniphilus sp. MSJ-1]|uniref:Uncharacterized protein n=1 Tax=Peptoniphilus ovalis TaxID=2841503 RepID=A0ABS6FH46_9FIRM|nr:hypothetical protein [Peptoniphilus ovalis]MBU5669503.1 hypothetical protein [Peptoniphilus ovalis]
MEIHERGKVILNNLAPLIGARPNSKRWNPRVGSVVAKKLRIASLVCLDLQSDIIYSGKIKYKFKNKLTLQASKIHELASSYSPAILNTDYILESVRGGKTIKEITDLLFLKSLDKSINDSAILDILEETKEYETKDVYMYILYILLESYSVYYSLYQFCYENVKPDKMQLGHKRITQLADNIEYVKCRLSNENINTINLTHHLSVLLMNILSINYDINRYFIES